MARVVEGFFSFTCAPTLLSTNEMNLLPSLLVLNGVGSVREFESRSQPLGIQSVTQ